jgi:hypothetical protein
VEATVLIMCYILTIYIFKKFSRTPYKWSVVSYNTKELQEKDTATAKSQFMLMYVKHNNRHERALDLLVVQYAD